MEISWALSLCAAAPAGVGGQRATLCVCEREMLLQNSVDMQRTVGGKWSCAGTHMGLGLRYQLLHCNCEWETALSGKTQR